MNFRITWFLIHRAKLLIVLPEGIPLSTLLFLKQTGFSRVFRTGSNKIIWPNKIHKQWEEGIYKGKRVRMGRERGGGGGGGLGGGGGGG